MRANRGGIIRQARTFPYEEKIELSNISAGAASNSRAKALRKLNRTCLVKAALTLALGRRAGLFNLRLGTTVGLRDDAASVSQ
jgi:hypothetical protein